MGRVNGMTEINEETEVPVLSYDEIAESPYDALDDEGQDEGDDTEDFTEETGEEPTGDTEELDLSVAVPERPGPPPGLTTDGSELV